MAWSREDLAWAAGFLEGEGSFSVNTTGNSKIPTVQAAQVQEEPIDRLLKIFPFGRKYGPYQHKRGKQPHYRFTTHTLDHSQAIAAAVWQWMSPRRKQQITNMLTTCVRHLNERPKARYGPIPRPPKRAVCHPELLMKAKGLCERCYRQSRKS